MRPIGAQSRIAHGCILLAAASAIVSLLHFILIAEKNVVASSNLLTAAPNATSQESAPVDLPSNFINISRSGAVGNGLEDAYDHLSRLYLSRILHEFNPTLRLPLLRLTSPAESSSAHRLREATVWLKSSVSVVFAATVRNAMRGLPSTADQMRRLAEKFKQAAFVFVENDSSDQTRSFLVDWRRRDSRVRLLGCGGSEAPCKINVSYSTGRRHSPGWSYPRNEAEHLERGVVMSAIRNIYLTYVYKHLASADSLLIVVDADLSFKAWNVDAILQGLYYFRDRPQLQSLCAHTRFRKYLYDTCTLQFYSNRHFSQSNESDVIQNFGSKAFTGPAPVKVDSCFQAFTVYRLSHLAEQQLMYGPAVGETVCEHITMSRQLAENYIDLNMRLDVLKQNEGQL